MRHVCGCLSSEVHIRQGQCLNEMQGSTKRITLYKDNSMPRDLGFRQRNENSAYKILWNMELIKRFHYNIQILHIYPKYACFWATAYCIIQSILLLT